jgi:MoxR-like ATPase
MRIRIGYPSPDDEEEVLRSQTLGHPLDDLSPVLGTEEVGHLQEAVRQVRVDSSILRYCLQIAEATRRADQLDMGVSPRGTLALRRTVQARAYLDGRDYAVPDDVKALVLPVLAHRVIPRAGYAGATDEAEPILGEILGDIPVPV